LYAKNLKQQPFTFKLNFRIMSSSKQKMTISIASIFLAFVMVFALPFNAFSSFDEPEEEEVTFRFSEEQLLNFFDANQEISAMQREMQQKMSETVAQHDMTLERFNQIARANQIGALTAGTFTDDEINAFNQLGPQISQIQREQQSMVGLILEDKGFTTASYQEILTDYRRDEQLQAHVRELLRERRRQEILEERRREAEEKAQQDSESERS
jgi:hypothetical protein